MMGGALGAIASHWLPVGDASLWALVGMAAIMGGTMRSPFTSVVFALELTDDFHTLPVLFIGTIAALGVTVLLMRRSILTEKIARRGHHVSREYSVDQFELLRVHEVMDVEAPTVSADTTVRELAERIARHDPKVSRRQAVLILDEAGKLAGIVTRGDLLHALRESGPETKVIDAGKQDLVITYPDEQLGAAVSRMLANEIGRLPVVDRADPKRLLGYLGRTNVVEARYRVDEEEYLREPGLLAGGAKPVLQQR
jgi:CBS domain-containing protein